MNPTWNPWKKYHYHERAKEALYNHIGTACEANHYSLTGKYEWCGAILEFEIILSLGKDPYTFEKYVFEVNENFKEILSGKYKLSHGKGTYAEVQLTQKDIDTLVDYYKIKDMDLYYMFHRKIIS